jgi:DNA modification methylase
VSWDVRECDVLDGLRSLPDGSVHCCVTSPPYFALRDYGVAGQIGLEATPEAYVAKMVEVFGEVRRVLRDDASLWLNIGDSYWGSWANYGGGARGAGKQRLIKSGSQAQNPVWDGLEEYRPATSFKHDAIKPKDLIGIPWLLAFALRADGWYLRSEIIWHKRSPMPESVQDRPTKAHEQVFLLSKSPRYFYDQIASREPVAAATVQRQQYGRKNLWGHIIEANGHSDSRDFDDAKSYDAGDFDTAGGRNMRSVWTLSTECFSGAHFATYPTELVRRCLLAGTSEKGCCPTCGAPWRRETKRERRPTRLGEKSKVYKTPDGWDTAAGGHGTIHREGREKGFTGYTHKEHRDDDEIGNRDPERHVTEVITIGWQPGCKCGGEPQPCLVLDPFAGAGTTGVVARRLGLRFIGFELNPTYAEMARRRIRDDAPLLNAS